MEVIFPHYEESAPNFIPNRIVAITHKEKSVQKEMGLALEAHIKEKYSKLCETIFHAVGIDICNNKTITKQLQSIPCIYWTFSPLYNGYEKDYPLLVSKINQIKSIRPFTQLLESPHKKCSLYSQHNAIIINTPEPPPFICKEGLVNLIENPHENRCRYAVKSHEHLSAFAFMKRIMVYGGVKGYNSKITSVAHMLAKYRIKKAALSDESELLADLKTLEDHGAIEAIFDLQNRQVLTTEEYSLESIKKANILYKRLENSNIQLKCYYSLIKFDGDGFGDLYKKNADKNNHKAFSESIVQFAKRTQEIIEKNQGVSIFAGGEDFLGFVPINNIFNLLKELRTEFQATVKLKGYLKPLTFSAGIAIAHYMDPLSNILKLTKLMEDYAKQIDKDKDAFAIRLVKRSGETLSLRCKFGEKGANLQLFHDIGLKMMKANTSKRLFYHLITILEPLQNDYENKDKMVNTLIKYAIQKADVKLDKEDADLFPQLYYALGSDILQFIKALNFLAFWMRECM